MIPEGLEWPREVTTDQQRHDIAVELITSYINHNIQNCIDKKDEKTLDWLISFVHGFIVMARNTECIDFFESEELTTMLEDKTRGPDEQ